MKRELRVEDLKFVEVTPEGLEAAEYEWALADAQSAKDVDAVFKDLAKLDAATRKRIVRELERGFVEDTVEMVREQLKPALKQSPDALTNAFNDVSKAEQAEEAEIQIRVVQHIAQALGDKSRVLTKSFVQQAEKMSAEDRQSLPKLLEVVLVAYDQTYGRNKKPAPKAPKA